MVFIIWWDINGKEYRQHVDDLNELPAIIEELKENQLKFQIVGEE